MRTVKFEKETLRELTEWFDKDVKTGKKILKIIEETKRNPYEGKKLQGDLAGFYSLRLTYQDRIIYHVEELEHCVYIHRVKTHYGD